MPASPSGPTFGTSSTSAKCSSTVREQFRAELLAGLTAAPDGPPLLLLFHAYRATFDLLERNRPLAEPRSHVIGATPALQEREAAKLAAVNRTLAEALLARGVEASLAALATEVGMARLRSGDQKVDRRAPTW